jgi:integrase
VEAMSVLEKMNKAEVRAQVWDSGEPQSVSGLHLRVYASGRKCFFFSYTTRFGIRRNPKVGENIGLTEARRRAGLLKGQVMIGLDPKGDWDEARNEKTVGEVFKAVLEKHWSQERYIKSGREKAARLIWHKYLEPEFSGQKISEDSVIAIRNWHNRLSDRPTTANRALEVLSKVFAYAVEQGWTTRNPCEGVKAFREKKRTRVATKEELKNILTNVYEIVKTPENKFAEAALFILALIFTGARPKDLKEARWSTFVKDPEAGHGVLTFFGKSTADSGEMERVVFPKVLVDLIEKFPRREDGRIFGSQKVRALWDKITADVGCQDLWSRDLRRTFASVGLSKGVSLDSIAETLNHKSSQTTKTYARAFDNSRVEVTNEIAEHVAKIGELI